MKRMWKFASVAAAASMVLAACGGSDSSTDTTAASDTTAAASEPAASDIKVAVVYLGVPDDKGWTYQHEQGIAAAEAETGVTIKRVENVLDNADSEKTFEQLASEGYNLIFATSFGYGAPMAKVAAKYPAVCTQWATGAKFLLTTEGGGEFATFDDVPKNLGTYFGAAEEARYLSGLAAGKATKNGQLGYVAAFPIPEVIRGINAFTLGVRAMNPSATVKVSWTSTWFDPTKEKQAAEALLDSGVDVIAQHQDTTEPGVAAEAAGAFWVGYNSDVREAAPKAFQLVLESIDNEELDMRERLRQANSLLDRAGYAPVRQVSTQMTSLSLTGQDIEALKARAIQAALEDGNILDVTPSEE